MRTLLISLCFIIGCCTKAAAIMAIQYKVIHVFVALCDNQYQGIVPVPARIGNGQDPDQNLYWGCGYGIRTYFNNSKEWTLVRRYKPADTCVLERLVYRSTSTETYLVADAYNGKYIRECTRALLQSCAGLVTDTVYISRKTTLDIKGGARLLAYIGHDGLMDFQLKESFVNNDDLPRGVIILACKSKQYFTAPLKATKAYPLVWTTGLMSPEAYTLHDALSTYLQNGSMSAIRNAAAAAYARYQHCSTGAAKKLLVTGW